MIPAKHLFIHWSRFGRHGIAIMCSPAENTPGTSVQAGMVHSQGWSAEVSRRDGVSSSQGPLCSQPARAEPLCPAPWGSGCSNQPQPCSSTQSPSCFICLSLPLSCSGRRMCWPCWTSHPPPSIVSSLTSPKRVTAACGGMKGIGEGSTGVDGPCRGRERLRKLFGVLNFFVFLQMVFQYRNIWRYLCSS